MENENKTKHEPSVEAFNLAQRIFNAGKNWNRNDDGLDVPSSARLIDELLEQSSERVSVDAIVSLPDLFKEIDRFQQEEILHNGHRVSFVSMSNIRAIFEEFGYKKEPEF